MNLNALLMQASHKTENDLHDFLYSRGWHHLARSKMQIYLCLSSGITRSCDIAEALNITRQAVHGSVVELAQLKYLALERSTGDDRREKHLVNTEKGARLQQDVSDGLAIIDANISALIVDDFAAFGKSLSEICGSD